MTGLGFWWEFTGGIVAALLLGGALVGIVTWLVRR